MFSAMVSDIQVQILKFLYANATCRMALCVVYCICQL